MKSVALVALVACNPQGIPGEVVTRGRHLELHADPRIPVCAESIAHVDDYLEATAALLGVDVPDVTYYLYDGDVEGCRILAASGEVFDCAAGTTVYASVWPHYHELVHAVARPWGRPPAFLVEGLAEGLGGDYPRLMASERATAELATDSVDFYATNVAEHYQAAADFAIYLLRRFGVAKYRELSTSLLYLVDPATLERRFSEITGNRLDTTIAAWRTGDPLDGPLQPLDAARCNAPAADPDGADAWQGHPADDCAESSVGPGRQISSAMYRSFDVAMPGLYQLGAAIGASVGRSFVISGCGTADVTPFIDDPGAGNYDLFPLAAGPHSIEVGVYRELTADPIQVDWSLSRVGDLGATCETAAVWHAPAPDFTLSLDSTPAVSWPGGTATTLTTWLRVDGAEQITEISPIGVQARVCQGTCDALASCTDATNRDLSSYPLVPGQSLYFELSVPADWAYDTYLIVRGAQNTMPIRGPSATARSRLPRSDWTPSTPYGSTTTWR